jgi:hypothetical protein
MYTYTDTPSLGHPFLGIYFQIDQSLPSHYWQGRKENNQDKTRREGMDSRHTHVHEYPDDGHDNHLSNHDRSSPSWRSQMGLESD